MSPASHESNTSYTPLSLRDVLPSLPGNRPLVAAVSRIRRACQRHVRVLPAGLHVRLPHGVGEDHPRPARCAHPPLQPCDVEATTEGVSMSIDQTLRLLAKARSEEHTSELQSLMRISYAVFCLTKKKINTNILKKRLPNPTAD